MQVIPLESPPDVCGREQRAIIEDAHRPPQQALCGYLLAAAAVPTSARTSTRPMVTRIVGAGGAAGGWARSSSRCAGVGSVSKIGPCLDDRASGRSSDGAGLPCEAWLPRLRSARGIGPEL